MCVYANILFNCDLEDIREQHGVPTVHKYFFLHIWYSYEDDSSNLKQQKWPFTAAATSPIMSPADARTGTSNRMNIPTRGDMWYVLTEARPHTSLACA